MSYNVKIDKNVQSEQNIIREFKAGLHDNVILDSVEFKSINEKINNNEPVLVFNFIGANQEVYNFIEYPVDFTRDDAEKKALSQGIRIKHILTKFVDEDSINLTDATSYADFANKVINTLGDKYKNVKVAIKLVYNQKGNVEFTKTFCFCFNCIRSNQYIIIN